MGRLLFMSDFKLWQRDESGSALDPTWYFENAYCNSGQGSGWRWEIDVNISFPHAMPIHDSHFGIDYNGSMYGASDEQKRLKIDIRRFIERNCQGTCVYTHRDMDYSYVTKIEDEEKQRLYDYCEWRQGDVKHGFHVFNFEYESDAIAFRMAFPQCRGFFNRSPIFEVDEEDIQMLQTLRDDRSKIHRIYKSHY